GDGPGPHPRGAGAGGGARRRAALGAGGPPAGAPRRPPARPGRGGIAVSRPVAPVLRGLAATLLLAGCTPGGAARTAASIPATSDGPAIVDVAVGASETVGAGTGDRLRSAWPQVLYTAALPPGAVLYT